MQLDRLYTELQNVPMKENAPREGRVPVEVPAVCPYLRFFSMLELRTRKVRACSAWNTASSLPVAAATPVPAAPPAAAPIRAPLPPPARAPIRVPAAAPPPIFSMLPFLWLLPLVLTRLVLSATSWPSSRIEVRRTLSSPGACSRPLGLACATTPVTDDPARAMVLPRTTMLRARVPWNV